MEFLHFKIKNANDCYDKTFVEILGMSFRIHSLTKTKVNDVSVYVAQVHIDDVDPILKKFSGFWEIERPKVLIDKLIN